MRDDDSDEESKSLEDFKALALGKAPSMFQIAPSPTKGEKEALTKHDAAQLPIREEESSEPSVDEVGDMVHSNLLNFHPEQRNRRGTTGSTREIRAVD